MEIHKLEEAVEQGKNEIIELLNLRASTKGKLQRYDTMMEQISIRKVELNQRHLSLKSQSVQLEAAGEQYRCLLYTSFGSYGNYGSAEADFLRKESRCFKGKHL